MTPLYDYDRETDILYISFAPGEKATTAVELNENMLLRFNRSEKRVIGVTLMDFSVLVQMTDLGPRQFPLSGLEDLEPEWREMVIEMLTKAPVNQILKVSVYATSFEKPVPLVLVEKPSLSLAA